MKKILVLVGKKQIENRECESYQVLINLNYLSRDYSGEQEREEFLAETSEEFAEYIAGGGISGQVVMFNGGRINKQGKMEKIRKLEESVAERFGELLREKITKSLPRGAVVPAESVN